MSADGTWKVTINSPMGVQQGTLEVATSGATFTGACRMSGRSRRSCRAIAHPTAAFEWRSL